MSTTRLLCAAFAFSVPVVAFACARDAQPVVTDPRPGAPAYWESELPREPAPPSAAAARDGGPGPIPAPTPGPIRDGGSPPVLDGGYGPMDAAVPQALPGTTDHFLWDQEATSPVTPPEAQTPLRSHAPQD